MQPHLALRCPQKHRIVRYASDESLHLLLFGYSKILGYHEEVEYTFIVRLAAFL